MPTPQADAQQQIVEPGKVSGNIVFYNVENLFDTKKDPKTDDNWFLPDGPTKWDTERYNTKLSNLAEAISWTGEELPLLVGMCEVENKSVVEDLVQTDRLRKGNYGIVHYDSPDERGIDVALIYQQDAFTVTDSEALRVDLPDNDRTRDALHVSGTLHGTPIEVFVCHWPSRSKGQEETEPDRIMAATVVRESVDKILKKDPNASIVVMGDFNDYPDNRSIAEVMDAACERTNTSSTFVNLVCPEHNKEHGTYNYKGEWGYLDQFLVSQGFMTNASFTVGEAKALWKRELLFDHPKFGRTPSRTYGGPEYYGGYSDHLPIVLELR